MDDRTRGFIAGLAGAAAILVFASWFDTNVVASVDREVIPGFDPGDFGVAYGVGAVVVAGLVLAIAGVGWRLRSIRLGLVYAVIGAILAFALYLGIEIPVTPIGLDLTSVLRTLELWTTGPLHAVSIVGGAMLIVGVAQVVAAIVHRSVDHRPPASLVEPLVPPEVPPAMIEDVAGPARG